jgi:PhoH-like ATPase
MRRQYVLDTSTLISDPTTFRHFPDSDVILPISVLNELDGLKKLPSQAGKNARVAIRFLDEVSQMGDIGTGILLDNDTLLKIDTNYIDLSQPEYHGLGDPHYGDTQILACLQAIWHQHPEHDVTLVSNDISLRVKAKARGIEAESHEPTSHTFTDLYSGVQTLVNEEAGMELQRYGKIDPAACGLEMSPHECVLFQADNGDGIAMGRLAKPGVIKRVSKTYPWGISGRNKEQSFAIDLIMDRAIDLVTLVGSAGTGKSLIALASALELVINRREYDKLIIYRPIQSVGNDIGYLPGELWEKLMPWFQAIMDNFEVLFSSKGSGDWPKELEMYQRKGKIEMEAITFIRGRSIPNSIILVDEAQNLNKEDIKTILTRAGEGSKVILTGDIEQIDNGSLDATNNGLTHVIDSFRSSELAGHITFTQGERSRLASLAANIL